MRGFEDIGSKGHFSAKKGVLGSKPPWAANENFFKNPLGTIFSTHQDVALCKKSSKSDARISRYGVTHGRTDGRTHGRTDERESIGLNG